MIDNRDIPLPADELKSRVLVFAITDEASHEYEEITKGYVELSTDEDDKNQTFHYLEVKDQLTNEVLMRSNLKLQNNFGKQKGSIISWTDEQQPQYQEIALSFEKDKECDMFWRTICDKIGKSYLEINGVQKLQTPNVNNLNYFLEKAKNSIDLMDYNIVHSKSIMDGLKEVFYEMKTNNDQFGMGTILRIINAIMCPSYSSNAIQTLLTGQNFYFLLDLQQFNRSISFREIYEQKVGQYLKNKFSLPRDIFQKIELSHRAIFYRQNVLDLTSDALLQSMMFMICKEAQVEIMSYLNRVKFFESLINYTEYPNLEFRQEAENLQQIQPISIKQHLNNDKIHFIHEALIMYNQITSEQIKNTFKQNIYSSKLLDFIKANIENHNLKALQILYCINEIDKQKFFQFLVENFKANSSDNMLKTLMKKFINQSSFKFPIIALIESMAPLFNLKRQYFDFFNGTFICSVFSVAKDSRSILLLANVLLAQLQNSSVLFTQFIKLKICEKLASDYRSGTLKSKAEELQILKFLKYIIIEQSHKGQAKNKEIESTIVDSGLFQCCMMIYLKHSSRNNVLSSSMLQNLKIIERMDYSQFHAYIVKEYSSNEALQKIISQIRAKHIEYVNRKMKQANDQEYLEVQRVAHEEILENQQQDFYLMNEEHDNLTNQSVTKDLENGSSKNHLLSPEPQKESTKEDQLMFLKRMMGEIKQDEDDAIQRQPRKIVKKSQDSKQTAIQFFFDLPDMDEIQQEQLNGT